MTQSVARDNAVKAKLLSVYMVEKEEEQSILIWYSQVSAFDYFLNSEQ